MAAEPPPLCAKCNRPVTTVSKWHDDARRAEVWKGYCHGTVDRVVITDEWRRNDPDFRFVFFEEPEKT